MATATTVPGRPGPGAAALPARRQVAAVAVGNALEFYDFVTYSFFAAQIGRAFFPSADPSIGLLMSLATFGVGFLMRPVGALVIGRMGDRLGRKPAMIVSFALMGVGLLGVGLTPSYASVGVAAPVMVVLFRMLQGFALGGEVGPSTSFLVEIAPPEKRGLYVSLQYASADAAIVVAGIVGYVLSSALSLEALDAWGWRAALLLGVAIVPVGLLLRASLTETVDLPDEGGSSQAAKLGAYLPLAGLGLVLLAGGTVASYGMDYLNTYAQTTLGMRVTTAFLSTLVMGLSLVATDLVSGRLSDHFGRKPVMMTAACAFVLSIIPCFLAMSTYRSPAVLLAATAWMSVLAALSSVPVLVAVTESLPRHIRSGSLAIIYAVAISIFGGSTQFVVAWLIHLTGDPMAPAWYITGFAVFGLFAMLWLPETAPSQLMRSRSPPLKA